MAIAADDGRAAVTEPPVGSLEMAGPYTIDASVFLNAFHPTEVGHEISHRLIARLQAEAIPIIVPTLILPEVAGAIARGHADVTLGRRFAVALAGLPRLVLLSLDTALGERAADIAARHRLRGSDAVYAAVALQFATTLVTLDREQREHVSGIVPTRTPSEIA